MDADKTLTEADLLFAASRRNNKTGLNGWLVRAEMRAMLGLEVPDEGEQRGLTDTQLGRWLLEMEGDIGPK